MITGDMMDLRQRAEQKVDAKIKFQKNLYKYIVVNSIIAVVSFVFLKSYGLLMAIMLFWGIGVVCDFLKAYSFDNIVRGNYRERMIEKEISKMGE